MADLKSLFNKGNGRIYVKHSFKEEKNAIDR